jgi:hypothetical protein
MYGAESATRLVGDLLPIRNHANLGFSARRRVTDRARPP